MNICVFSSSSNTIADCYLQEAKKLATLIAAQKWNIVNGGVNLGLMEIISSTAKDNGVKTTGVVPQFMQENKLVSENSQQVIITQNMMERKAKMREISNAFIALPGGFGTLEEILEVITLKQLHYLNKAIVILNTNNFYDDLLRQFEKWYKEKFAKENYRKIYFVANNAEEAVRYISNYSPEDLDTKWHQVPTRK